MAKKNEESVKENLTFYEDYFKEELQAIEEELLKSKEYSKIIDAEINKLSGPSLGSNKGAQHYLIEHITNAVQLQTQRQGLRRDKFNIKKAIIDYAAKFADTEESSGAGEILSKIDELIKHDKETAKQQLQVSSASDIDLDAEIDKTLNGEG